MSVWGTRTKHAGYTIRTPANKEKKKQAYFTVFHQQLTFKIAIRRITLPVALKFTYLAPNLAKSLLSSLLYALLYYMEDLGE